jgi:pilus assembly protein Flp/PilA
MTHGASMTGSWCRHFRGAGGYSERTESASHSLAAIDVAGTGEAMHRLIPQAQPNESGATAVEYAIMAVLIAVVIIIAVVFLGEQVSSDFDCTGSVIDVPENASYCG